MSCIASDSSFYTGKICLAPMVRAGRTPLRWEGTETINLFNIPFLTLIKDGKNDRKDSMTVASLFRVLSLDYGADLVYTEEIVDQKLLSATRKENREFLIKYCRWRSTIDYRLSDIDWNSFRYPWHYRLLHWRRRGVEVSVDLSILSIVFTCFPLRIASERERGKVVLQIGTNNGESAAKVAAMVYVHIVFNVV